MKSPTKKWFCYILRSLSTDTPNKTYVGFTNNPSRRLRQHNGIIKGGAKSTKSGRPFEHFCILEFKEKKVALQAEWLLKHPNGKRNGSKRYQGVLGKLKGVDFLILESEKWKSKIEKDFISIEISSEFVENINQVEISKKVILKTFENEFIQN